MSSRFSMAVQKWFAKLKGKVVETSTFSIYAIWHLNFKALLKHMNLYAEREVREDVFHHLCNLSGFSSCSIFTLTASL